MDFWRRSWELIVGNVRLSSTQEESGLALEFSVKKSLRREPNTATITILNLSKQRRDQIRSNSRSSVVLSAGYEGTRDQIFSGDIESTPGTWENANVGLTLEGSDGGRAYRESRIQRSFGPGTSVSTVLQAAIQTLGIGLGNFNAFRSQMVLPDSGTTYPDGTVLSGRTRDHVDRIVRACNLTWSIQNGNLQLRARRPEQRSALRLTPESGLIGSPTQEKDGRNVFVNATMLLHPGAYPGRLVVLESRETSGNYEIYRVEYTGETRGPSWYASLQLRPY